MLTASRAGQRTACRYSLYSGARFSKRLSSSAAPSARKRTTSASARLSMAIRTISRFIISLALCRPGVSSMIIWYEGPFTMPRIRFLVVCGRGLTMAIFWPSSRLSRVDLPALGGPTMATTPDRYNGVSADDSGSCSVVIGRFSRSRFVQEKA